MDTWGADVFCSQPDQSGEVTMSDTEGMRFTAGRAQMLEQAILTKVPGAVVDEVDSQLSPGARALSITHERVAWELEVVPLWDDGFLILLRRHCMLFSEDWRGDRARRGLEDSGVDWVVETVERAFRCGAVSLRRRSGVTGSFLGDNLGDITRELKSGGEIIVRFPPIE